MCVCFHIHTCTLKTSCIARVTCKISFRRSLQFYPRSCHTVPPNPFSFVLRHHHDRVGLLLTSAQQQQRQHEGVNDRGLSLYYVIGLNYTHTHTRAPMYTYIHIIAPAVNWIKAQGTHMARRKLILFVKKKKMNTYTHRPRVYCVIIKDKNIFFRLLYNI